MSTEAIPVEITKTRFSRLRRMHSIDAGAESIAKKAAEKIVDPTLSAPTLVVAAFQSSI